MPRLLVACTLAAMACGLPATAAERICGWYANPTPGNLLITDRRGDWWITQSGAGPDARGLDHAPPFDAKQFVETNVPGSGHGYGCACLTAETDPKARRITRILAGEILPLARCKADKALPAPQ
ncbi:DUF4087 domain-containing protein [Bordetella petrii]|uniref:DUF4087 domain-containing protein n=1 Tax=Bordetella petrii TaxID=94624 RepID=UPI00373250C7